MAANFKRKLFSIVLRALNRVFDSRIELEDLASVRILANENLHLRASDVESIRLLLKEEFHFSASDVDSIRLVVKEQLHFSEANVKMIRVLLTEASHLKEDQIRDLGQAAQLCYSQEGESLILDRLLDSRKAGFFVDVGAHHPKRFSNTYALYKRGWRGINIDPTPGVKALFDEFRPRDVFVAAAVSCGEGAQDFYIFMESALNTLSKDLADEYQEAGYKLAEVRPINPKKLSTLLHECKVDHPIDLMSIDVEGHEFDVLQSSDWEKYRPCVLLVEIINFDLSRPETNPVHNFLLDRGYVLFAKTYNTVFYKDARVPEGALPR